MKATIQNTEATTWEHKGERIAIWKVTITDDISENTASSTYFIDRKTRGLLRQEIDLGSRTMVMERKD